GLVRAVQAMLHRPAQADGLARALHIVIEKILMPDERLPARWPIAGTTGYEFLNAVNGLFVDPAGARSLTATYARFIAARLEIAACFPVYRTYIATEDAEVTERDRRYVEAAVAEARRRNPSVSASVFEFIRSLLCLDLPADTTQAERAEVLAFVGRFQQLTGP